MSVEISLGGIPMGTLTIVFLILKLCDVIDWSWWWVLSPLWIGLGLYIITLLFVLLILLMVWMAH